MSQVLAQQAPGSIAAIAATGRADDHLSQFVTVSLVNEHKSIGIVATSGHDRWSQVNLKSGESDINLTSEDCLLNQNKLTSFGATLNEPTATTTRRRKSEKDIRPIPPQKESHFIPLASTERHAIKKESESELEKENHSLVCCSNNNNNNNNNNNSINNNNNNSESLLSTSEANNDIELPSRSSETKKYIKDEIQEKNIRGNAIINNNNNNPGQAFTIVATRAIPPPKAGSIKEAKEVGGQQRSEDANHHQEANNVTNQVSDDLPAGKQSLHPVIGFKNRDFRSNESYHGRSGSSKRLPEAARGGARAGGLSQNNKYPLDDDSKLTKTISLASRQSDPKPPFPFAGIISTLCASLLFSFSALLIKLLPDSTSGMGLQEKLKALLFRGLFMSVLSGSTIFLTKSTFKVKRNELMINFLRSLFGSAAVLCGYFALEWISLGDSTALIFSSTIWTNLLSYFFLNEPLHWILIPLLPASMIGIIFIAHPTLLVGEHEHLSLNHHISEELEHEALLLIANHSQLPDELNELLTEDTVDHLEERWPGIVIALIGSLLVSLVFIVLKYRKETPIQTTTFWFSIGQMVMTLVFVCFMGFGQLPTTTSEWLLLIGNAIFSWFGQIMLQWAFSHEEAGVISMLRTSDVAISFILSAIFLDDEIYWTSIVGAVILGCVVILIILKNWIELPCCCSFNSSFKSSNNININRNINNNDINNFESRNQNEIYGPTNQSMNNISNQTKQQQQQHHHLSNNLEHTTSSSLSSLGQHNNNLLSTVANQTLSHHHRQGSQRLTRAKGSSMDGQSPQYLSRN